jgi:hypothetical protein
MATVAEMSMSLDGFAVDPSGQAGPPLGWYGNGEVGVPAASRAAGRFRTSDASARYLRESMKEWARSSQGGGCSLRVAGARPGSRSAYSSSPAPGPRSGRVRMRRCRSPSTAAFATVSRHSDHSFWRMPFPRCRGVLYLSAPQRRPGRPWPAGSASGSSANCWPSTRRPRSRSMPTLADGTETPARARGSLHRRAGRPARHGALARHRHR